ncbi:bacteriohemerythrin [Candidatus Magnetaquicoccus inordinatus]|uniref:bacteriohemerythrin n=1 Tax=Candidatus Magnetaquicoccus inordinatus TaxID=2496818 RepID=UPI00102B0255|nr:bacteriohemerythrin [Candidatus Magnetaquicoccus inordinatus]
MTIQKISVAKGIHWVEIPEANLRILCGCPMDCVKHLMKRGLIVATEKNGIPCETGPNAILLSDLMLQNGEFANLGDFPVLQMLYKQGLILPNHPNNTGQKPLLIGRQEQVNAQLQYIYRGNYGLVSTQEIEESGVDAQTAAAMMRMKLRFAFGAIRSSRDLLETCIIENEAVTIGPGVTLLRRADNIFEISHEGTSVTVDLNLAPGERYESAYPLGYQMLTREYFAVVHSGDGDGWDVNRPSMSSIVMFQGKIYLVDAGPNLYNNLQSLGIGIDEVEGLFHTHAHDDHFAGITTLMRAGRKIKYFATRLVRASVEKKLSALLAIEEEQFRDYFAVHDLQADSWNDIEGLEVRPCYSPHPLETTIFMFRTLWKDGYKTYAHFADIISLDLLRKMINEDPKQPGIDAATFAKVCNEYLTPAHLKKLDIGGGMIHGVAKDFQEDRSQRILLSHIARELTPEEREIGSNAPHGMMDVLIHGLSDAARRSAFAFLQSALPEMPLHHLRILLNAPIIPLPPGKILLKEGEMPEEIYLVLSGTVDLFRTKEQFSGKVTIGVLIGEDAVLHKQPSRFTYSTACFVQALAIPSFLFLELVERNNLLNVIETMFDRRSFLQATTLFSEGVPYPVLDQIVQAAHSYRVPANHDLTYQDMGKLHIIRSGTVIRSLAGEQVDILSSRDFFGEEMALFGSPSLFSLTTSTETELYQIPGELLQEIPIVRWKLFEGYQKRALQVIHGTGEVGNFKWNNAFNVQIAEMDIHHKKLLEIANGIMEIVHANQGWGPLEKAFSSLVQYTEYHFSAEERLLQRYGYPGLEQHQKKHRLLVEQVHRYREQIKEHQGSAQIDFSQFFNQWIVRHVLNEDRSYSQFLNDKGVY